MSTDILTRRIVAASLGLLISTVCASPGQAQNSALMNGKWVTIVGAEEPTTLDGCQMSGQAINGIVRANIFETLTELDPVDSSVKPRLATSWERINDTTWRFKLRPGVKFHDGAPFNAEAAAKGIARTIEKGKELACTTRSRFFDDLPIKGTAVDELTLDIVTPRPEPILPTRMSLMALVSPNTDLTKAVLNPVGTGPYRFVSWSPGTDIVIERNNDYWGQKPFVEGARYIWRNESSVRAAMVKIGEADIAAQIAAQDANEPGLDVSYPSPETTQVRIELNRKPLDDVRVRLALNYAFDFASVRGSILPKDVMQATQIIGPNVAGHNHEIDKKIRPYDPNRARQLLSEAKAAGTPVDTEMWFIGRTGLFPNSSELLEAMAGMWQAVGFNLKLRVVEQGQWRELQNKPYSPDRPPILFNDSHDNSNGDAVFSIYNKYACGGLQSYICDPRLDELIAKGPGLTGPERLRNWQEIFRISYEELVTHVWIAHLVGYTRVGNRINFKPLISTNIELPLANVSFK